MPTVHSTIRLGSQGPDVTAWQTFLAQEGLDVGTPDGIFGPQTRAATIKFQEKHGLDADGVVGPQTWAAAGFTVESSGGSSSSSSSGAGQTGGHARGRRILMNAWPTVFDGKNPNTAQLELAGAMSHLESNYGTASYANAVSGERISDSNNWGARQCGARPPCPANCFEATDKHADGTPYQACFKKYATPEEGAADVLRWYKSPPVTGHNKARHDELSASLLQALQTGDVDLFSASLHDLGYYEGFGSREQAIDRHASGIFTRAKEIAGALSEPLAVARGGPGHPAAATPPPATPGATDDQRGSSQASDDGGGGTLIAALVLLGIGVAVARKRR